MKKLLVLCLTVMMVFSTVACTTQDVSTQTSTDETAATTPAESADEGETAGETAATTSVRRDVLTVALAGEPDTLDPYGQSHEAALTADLLVYERLLRTDLDGNIYPWLATEYEVVDDTTLHFVLRDDVYFSDGSKFTAEDAAFSLKHAAESSFTTNLFGSIDPDGFVINGDYDLTVKLLTPNAAIIPAIAGTRCLMLSKDYYENNSIEVYGRQPMGTGPMVFEEWVAGDHYSFVKNENYWGDEIAYDRCVMRFISESSSRTIELETGGVDIACELAINDWSRVEENPDLQLISGNTLGTKYLCFNQIIEPFDDINVRLGLAHALDLETICNVVFQGTATVADAYYVPTILGYKAVGPMTYDPELAKEYLAAAGYDESNPLRFTYTTYENTVNTTFAQVVQSMWAAVGVEIEISVVDLSSFATMNNNGELNVSLLTTTAAMADPTAALLIWPLARTISIRHGDQHIQDLLDEGAATYDVAERTAVYEELQDYLWEQLYAVPVVFMQQAYGAQSYVQNLPFYPNLRMELDLITFSE